MPLVPVEELRALIEDAVGSSSAVILEHHGHQEPLMGVYDRILADKMLEEITEHKGSVFAFLRRVGYQCRQSCQPEEYFMNVNDPDAYTNLKNRYPDIPSDIYSEL